MPSLWTKANWLVFRPMEHRAQETLQKGLMVGASVVGSAFYQAGKLGLLATGRALYNNKTPILRGAYGLLKESQHFLMGGRGLFYSRINPAFLEYQSMARAGYNIPKHLIPPQRQITFNPTLRNRIAVGALGLAGLSSMQGVGTYQAPETAVHEVDPYKANLGGTGSMALSMYYSNK